MSAQLHQLADRPGVRACGVGQLLRGCAAPQTGSLESLPSTGDARLRSRVEEKAQRSRETARACVGFSLMEVLIAIMILGVALVAMTEGISLALQSNKDSELQSTASMVAAGVIETLRAEGDFENGEDEGECGEGLSLYRWKRSITGTDLDGLHDVKVTIENTKSGKAIYELETLLFQAPDDTTSYNSGRRTDATARNRRRR